MKLPRRNFLHLAAGAAALPAVPRIALAQKTQLSDQIGECEVSQSLPPAEAVLNDKARA